MRLSTAVLIAVTTTGAPSLIAQQAAPPIAQASFASLRWLEGRWVGSGGGYAAFYEEYRFLNDSTIEQREFPDSTFARPGRTSTIERRGGVVRKVRGATAESHLARVAGDTARFEPAVSGRRGFTWIRVSANEWRAVLDTQAAPVVYTLKRVAP